MTTPNFNLPLDWTKYPSERKLIETAFERIDAAMATLGGGASGPPMTTVATLTAQEDLTSGVPLFVPWDAAALDDVDGWTIGDPTKIVVPADVTRARVTLNAQFTTADEYSSFIAGVLLNAGLPIPGGLWSGTPVAADVMISLTTPWFAVVEGDYLRMIANISTVAAGGISIADTAALSVEFA